MKKNNFFPLILALLLFSCKSGGEADNVPNSEGEGDVTSINEVGNELSEENSANAANLVASKDSSKMNAAQLNIQKLLESCVSKKYSAASSVIMYRGADQSRIGKDSFNYGNANEANTVKVTCEVINGWLGTSTSYEFISYTEEETDFGTQYVVEVLFSKQKIGIERHFFYQMNTPKGLLLVNMI